MQDAFWAGEWGAGRPIRSRPTRGGAAPPARPTPTPPFHPPVAQLGLPEGQQAVFLRIPGPRLDGQAVDVGGHRHGPHAAAGARHEAAGWRPRAGSWTPR